MAGQSGFFSPLREAMLLARTPVALGVLAALVVARGTQQAILATLMTGQDYGSIGLWTLVLNFAGSLVSAVFIAVLGRGLLAGERRGDGGRWLGWAGLMLLYLVGSWFLSALVGLLVAMVASDMVDFAMIVLLLVPVLTLLLPGIVLFPMLVRLLAIAGGRTEPRLGGVWSRLWGSHWRYCVCYLLVLVIPAIALNGLTAMGGQVTRGDMLTQGVIGGAVTAFGYLVAAAAARALSPTGTDTAQVFE